MAGLILSIAIFFKANNWPKKQYLGVLMVSGILMLCGGSGLVIVGEQYISSGSAAVIMATESSEKIFTLFNEYLATGDFVGADMARKYLQMGYTRGRRYANYKGGRKYDGHQDYALLERGTGDPQKAEAAKVFYARWKAAEKNEVYAAMKKIGSMRGVKKENLPQKLCVTCGKPFRWRKKWEKVKYCSEKSKRSKIR